ncbi:hypothetical protein CSOJ01_09718 [Colletotrichum sojae]|uniref:Tautomerase cis-CaaD-like domain-containing protein n=1 Tax=Colletotrichum sojae TaxID=2175907 RepID=A0A8H6J2X4_9PEZI|nr:hypothetical protein CSOJ01_09718 [Colletotrichum sojae]
MPLWTIYHTPDSFVDNASKQALAKDITKIYLDIGLPAFYVIVNFLPTPAGTAWKGGEIPDRPFVRLVIDHVAVHIERSIEDYRAVTAAFEEALKPHVADKGYDWEYHTHETERELWRVNGYVPPQWQSEAEKLWARENRPVPFKPEDGIKEFELLSPVKKAAEGAAAQAAAASKK